MAGVSVSVIWWFLAFIGLIQLIFLELLLQKWRQDLVAVYAGIGLSWAAAIVLTPVLIGFAAKMPGAG